MFNIVAKKKTSWFVDEAGKPLYDKILKEHDLPKKEIV
jgi:hypothetical protein